MVTGVSVLEAYPLDIIFISSGATCYILPKPQPKPLQVRTIHTITIFGAVDGPHILEANERATFKMVQVGENQLGWLLDDNA